MKPRAEQLRLKSSRTGEHNLDAYLEAAEKGSRQLADLLSELFDDQGILRTDNFEWRIDPLTRELQVRYGDYVSPLAGWVTVNNGQLLKGQGAYTVGKLYKQTDLISHLGSRYMCFIEHTAISAAPDVTKFELIGAAMTAPDMLAQIMTVDGAASGLDSDLLDGQHGAYYMNATNINAGTLADARLSTNVPLKNADNTFTGINQFLGTPSVANVVQRYGNGYDLYSDNTGPVQPHRLWTAGPDGGSMYFSPRADGQSLAQFNVCAESVAFTSNTAFTLNGAPIWHANNDGAGSTLDADLLDGQHGAYYNSLSNATGMLPTASFNDAVHGARAGGTLHSNATTSVNGFMSAADKVKLNNIASGAQVNPTNAEIKTQVLAIDGAGSGLDADLLDGQQGVYYTNIPARLGYTPVDKAALTDAPSKATPVDADSILINDSAAPGVFKSLTWANLKTALLSVFYGKSEVYTKTEADTAITTKTSGQMSGSAYPRRHDGETMSIQWYGQPGQPIWMLGSNDGVTWQVWHPNNFNVYAVGGWTQPYLESKFNLCVTDTRIAGFTSVTGAGTGIRELPSGYFVTRYTINNDGAFAGVSGRQPQVHIPAVGWRALGGW